MDGMLFLIGTFGVGSDLLAGRLRPRRRKQRADGANGAGARSG